ncbi:hypothetical protein [Halostagnicola bangensis]
MTWRCAWCDEPHESNDPPCDSCGYNSFNRGEDAEADDGTVDTAPTYVWTCTNCGREHMRNSPPCARCGNHTLEKTRQTFEDVDNDLEVPGWLEVAKPYSPVIVVIALVVALFATGIVPLSVLPGVGTDLPGEDTEAEGIDLEETALLVHERLTAEQEATGEAETDGGGELDEPLAYDDGLEEFATAENQRLVVDAYTDDDGGERANPAEFDLTCEQEPRGYQLLADSSIEEYETESELADDVADELLERMETQDIERPEFDAEGIDIHVGPDGSILVLYTAC